jgi:hypothetical protein
VRSARGVYETVSEDKGCSVVVGQGSTGPCPANAAPIFRV